MTHGKKAAIHIAGVILALSLFVYAGKMAIHAGAKHADLYLWSGVTLAALLTALAFVGMIHVAFGAEAARHRRQRFSTLIARMGAPAAYSPPRFDLR